MALRIRQTYSDATFIMYVSAYGIEFVQGQKPVIGTLPIPTIQNNAGSFLTAFNGLPKSVEGRTIAVGLNPFYEAHLQRAVDLGYVIPSEARQYVESSFIDELLARVPPIQNGGITCFLMTDGDARYSLLNVWPNPLTGFYDEIRQLNGHGVFVPNVGWFASPANEPQLALPVAYHKYANHLNGFLMTVFRGDDTVVGDQTGLFEQELLIYAGIGRMTKNSLAAHLYTEPEAPNQINIVSNPNNKRQVYLVNNNYPAPDYKFRSLDTDTILQGSRTKLVWANEDIDFSTWGQSHPAAMISGVNFITKISGTNIPFVNAFLLNATFLGLRITRLQGLPPPSGLPNSNGPFISVSDGVNTDFVWINSSPSQTRYPPFTFLQTPNTSNGWIDLTDGEITITCVNKTVRFYPVRTGIDNGSTGGTRYNFSSLQEKDISELISPKAVLNVDIVGLGTFVQRATSWADAWWISTGIVVDGDKRTLIRPAGNVLNSRISGFTWGAGTALQITNVTDPAAVQQVVINVKGDQWVYNQDTDRFIKTIDNSQVFSKTYPNGIIEFSRVDGLPFTNSLTSGDVIWFTPQLLQNNPAPVRATFTAVRRNPSVPRTPNGPMKLIVYGAPLEEIDEAPLIDAADEVSTPTITPPPDVVVDNVMSFRRNSLGSRLNEVNEYTWGAIDLPRLDYYESISGNTALCSRRCPILLFEPLRINVAENSNVFPFILNQFEQLLFPIDAQHQGQQYTNGLAYPNQPIRDAVNAELWNGSDTYAVTCSIYVKFIDSDSSIIGFRYTDGIINSYFFVDVSTGNAATGFIPNSNDVNEYGSQAMGNGFYRAWARFGDSAAYGTGEYSVGYLTALNEIQVAQFQVEPSDIGCYVPTNPIPTTTGIGLRDHDQCVITDLYSKGFFSRPDEGSVYLEFLQLDGSVQFGGVIADGEMPKIVNTDGEGLTIDLETNQVLVALNNTVESLPITRIFNRLFLTWRNGRARLLLNNKHLIEWTYSDTPNSYFFNVDQLNFNWYDLADRGNYRFGVRAIVFYPDFYPDLIL